MKKPALFVCSLGALLTLGATATADDAGLVRWIDDFHTGPLHQEMPQLPADWGIYYQAANVLGGVRQVNLIADDTLGASSRVDLDGGRLRVSTGIGSYFGTLLGYGYDANGGDGGMVGELAGYDYFQIDFERSDVGVEYIVEVFDGQGAMALLAGVLTTEAQSGPYKAKFRLNDFEGFNADGDPQDIEWDDIHYLAVLFQSANASGGNDFSVTGISVVKAP